MPDQKHDDWLSGLGIDVDQLRQTIAGGGLADPTVDPKLAKKSADAFAKGVAKEGQAFLDSAPVRMIDPTAPLRALTGQGIDALVSRDPSKIDPAKAVMPSSNIGGIDLNNPGATVKQINDPAEQQRAVATAKGILNQLADPLGGTIDTAKAEVNLAQSDPEKFSEQLGQGAVRGGIALGLALAGAGEVGVGGAADAGGAVRTGGVADLGPASAVGDAGAGGAAADAGASPLARTGVGPASEPPPAFDPTPGVPEQPVPEGVEQPQAARPDPRVDPEPPPDTIEEPPAGPQPPRQEPPTLRDPPAGPRPLRRVDPRVDPEPPPDTTEDPPAGPQPVREEPPTIRELPAGPQPARTPAATPDAVPDTEKPETLDAPTERDPLTLRDPPIPNPTVPFPDPDITLKPFEPAPLPKITVEPEPEAAPDTERTAAPPAQPASPAPQPASEPVPDTERTPQTEEAS